MIRFAVVWFDKIAGMRRTAVLIPGLLIILLRLAILPWNPVPDPMAPDEFSQLLAAKTFASGRMTNPTPPFWAHFEAPYVLLQPSYASKYPPGPPLIMALGIAATGLAWAGVLAAAGLMCSGFCWMLQGWAPPRWALAGALLAVARYSLHHYWLNSYWGGSLAAFGGALVLGALPRIRRGAGAPTALAMAAGFMILVVTRPYEGLLFSIVPSLVLLAYLFHAPRERLVTVLAPMATLIIIAGSVYLLYNWRVTGSPLSLPYAAYTAQYEPSPHFIWQSHRPVRPYLHRELEEYLTFPNFVERQRTVRAAVKRAFEVVGIAIPYDRAMLVHPKIAANILFGTLFLISALLVARDRSMRIPLIMAAIVIVGMIPETFFSDHYVAPAAGLMLLIVVQGLRHVAVLHLWRRGFGRALPVMISAAGLAAVALYSVAVLPFATHRPEYITVDRPRVLAHVSRSPGKHLLLVRFGSSFTIDDGEWIYNEPSIESARVIWARDMGREANAGLLGHFGDRQVWRVYKDRGPARVYREGGTLEPPLDEFPVERLLRTR